MQPLAYTQFIYGLFAADDPDQTIRYVGKTEDPDRRLSEHRQNKMDIPEKHEWIKSVQERGSNIEMKILCNCPKHAVYRLEREYIQRYPNLVNRRKVK